MMLGCPRMDYWDDHPDQYISSGYVCHHLTVRRHLCYVDHYLTVRNWFCENCL